MEKRNSSAYRFILVFLLMLAVSLAITAKQAYAGRVFVSVGLPPPAFIPAAPVVVAAPAIVVRPAPVVVASPPYRVYYLPYRYYCPGPSYCRYYWGHY